MTWQRANTPTIFVLFSDIYIIESKVQKIISCLILSTVSTKTKWRKIRYENYRKKLIHSKLLIRMRSFKMDRIMMKNCKKANSQFIFFLFSFWRAIFFFFFFIIVWSFIFIFSKRNWENLEKKLFNLLEVKFWMGNLAVKARSWLWYLCGFLVPNYRAFF